MVTPTVDRGSRAMPGRRVPTAATSATRAPLRVRSTRTRGYRGPAAAPERLSFQSARARDEALHCSQRRVRALDLLSFLDEASAWIAELPESVQPRQLALRYARLANRLCKAWKEAPKCEHLLDDLMMDRRGGRKGFPLQVANELATLRDYYFRLHHQGGSAWEQVEMGR